MANWKTIIDISKLHSDWDEEKISTQQVCKELIIKLQYNNYANDPEIIDIINDLRDVSNMSEDESDDGLVEEYNQILDRLYNFGDIDHRIWVNIFVVDK